MESFIIISDYKSIYNQSAYIYCVRFRITKLELQNEKVFMVIKRDLLIIEFINT